jgi:hypothetical protein
MKMHFSLPARVTTALCFGLAASAACAPPAVTPPATDVAPRASASLTDAADHSLPLAEYYAAGFPSIDHAWSGAEAEQALGAVEKLQVTRPDALPRPDSSRSSALFQRLIATDEAALQPDRPLGERMAFFSAEMNRFGRLLVAYLKADPDGRRGLPRALFAVVARALHVTSIGAPVAEDFIAALASDDPTRATRAQGFDRMRGGLVEQLTGFITVLGEPYPKDARAELAIAVSADVPRLADMLTRAEYRTLDQALAEVRKQEDDPALSVALGRVHAALREGTPPAITITAFAVTARNGSIIVPLPAERTLGAAAEFKRSGPNDLYILPLAKALSAMPKGGLRIDVDPSTPYRVLVEVLFTAGQHEMSRFELRELGAGGPSFHTYPPRVAGAIPFDLTMLVVPTGISLKARGGNVAPGCGGVGPGLAVPRRDGKHDYASLAWCLKKLKAEVPQERSVVVAVNPSVTYAEFLPLIEIARGEHLELFPSVIFGVTR